MPGSPDAAETRPPRTPVTPGGRRTRDALLAAGAEVAERAGLAGLSVNAVVEAAGVAKGTFYVHFADRDAFLDALHERFHAAAGEAVARAIEGTSLGAERLVRGGHAYLDTCLSQRAVKPLLRDLHHAGGCGPATTAAMGEREAAFVAQMVPNLRAMGCRDVRVVGRLLQAAISEAAMIEFDAGRRVPAARRFVRQLVESLAAPA